MDARFDIFSEVSVMIRDQADFNFLKKQFEEGRTEFGDHMLRVEFFDSKERDGGEVHIDWQNVVDDHEDFPDGLEPILRLMVYLHKLGKV